MTQPDIETETKYWLIIPSLLISALCLAILSTRSHGVIGPVYVSVLALSGLILSALGSILILNVRRHTAFPLAVYCRRIYLCGFGIALTSAAILVVSVLQYFKLARATGTFTFNGWYLPLVVCLSCIQDFRVFALSKRYNIT